MEKGQSQIKWYFKPVVVIIAIFCVGGPFALPLLWLSPAFKKSHKIVITILVVGLTLWLVKATINLYGLVSKQMQTLQDLLNS